MGETSTEFCILGALDVVVDGERIAVDSGKLRVLLAGLLLRANEVVMVDQLIDWLWEVPLVNPRGAIHTYVRRLRQALGDSDLLSTVANGYRLNVGADQLDLLRFRDLIEGAGRATDLATQADLLTGALALWRGPVLADVASDRLRDDAEAELDEERLGALERRFDIELRLGRHSALIRDLRAAAIDNPYRERFWSQLMLALYRAGRQAEALDVYLQARDLLIGQLGIEPGTGLRTLHERILESDPGLAVPDDDRSTAPATVPAQLPPDVVGFVGRTDLVDQVSAVLRPVESRTGTPIVVLSGPPGIGKSALAVYVGHQLRRAFPDGQLHVNLRGYDHQRDDQHLPLTPVQVLSQFLRGLGLPADQIPVELDEQVNLFRSKVAGKNILIVLDNAAQVDQVRPLIPGEPGCSVLVTSRHRLSGLAASNSAYLMRVDTLSGEESRALLEGTLRLASITLAPELVAEVADLCGNLPLALRIAAANLIACDDPDGYIDDLREGNRLAALSIGDDRQAAVAATIALSYNVIDAQERRMFRLLSLFPGPDFTAAAVAVLADTTTAQARNSLNRLAAASLIQLHAPGRYQFHDLLRQFARERAAAENTEAECAAAVERVGRWYVAAAHNASNVLYNEFVRLVLPQEMKRIDDAVHFSDESQAMAWLIAERRNLIAMVSSFAKAGPRWISWYVADALRGFFWTGKYRTDWLDAASTGLAAASRVDDKHGIASMSRSLANLFNTLGDYAQALSHHQTSLAVHQELDMPEEAAATLNNIGLAYLSLGRLDDADAACRQALGYARSTGSRRAESAGLGLLGSILLTRGEMAEATECLTASLATATELGMHHISSYGLRNLGLVCLAVGDLTDARAYFEQALEVSERIGSFYDKSIGLHGLALTHRDMGEYQVALDYAEQALVAFQECGDRTYEVDALCAISTISGGLGECVAAAEYAKSALSAAQQIDYVDGEASAHSRLAEVELRNGHIEQARAHAEAARRLVDAGVSRITEGRVRTELARIYLNAGAVDISRRCADQAIEVCRQTGQRRQLARALEILELTPTAI